LSWLLILSLCLNFALILCLYFVNKHRDLYIKKLPVDYTAALEKEIKQWFDNGTIRLTSLCNIYNLATSLNAAIQKQHCA
jgi:hypothetical protein